jgi:hypothetical protein
MTEIDHDRVEPFEDTADDQAPANTGQADAVGHRVGATIGYLVTIAINIAMLYVANHLPDWPVPFLTDKYEAVLWAINLSIGANILANVVWLFYDTRPVKHLLQAIINVPGIVSVVVFYAIFPLNVGDSDLAESFASAFWRWRHSWPSPP